MFKSVLIPTLYLSYKHACIDKSGLLTIIFFHADLSSSFLNLKRQHNIHKYSEKPTQKTVTQNHAKKPKLYILFFSLKSTKGSVINLKSIL